MKEEQKVLVGLLLGLHASLSHIVAIYACVHAWICVCVCVILFAADRLPSVAAQP